eukprot:CAMPEP_0170604082 /NCGR_PEP_ID=MMETSP0224-20130122/19239_1 /TAXON_ID=285029 /ORGANISM="Togula jolla, Strain CCCM 725" /LENGTH=254 /DNA_ID=CAMNT_0010928973 /DNA_START=161 /DNA_END=925 /DNA_ORIENTATION=-
MLDMSALLRLQAVDLAMKRSTDWGFCWAQCVKRQWPQLLAAPELYESQHRSCLVDCISLLEGSTLAKGTSLFLSEAKEACLLANALANCHNIAAAHLAGGGRVARVIVGNFSLPLVNTATLDAIEHRDLGLGEPTSFALGRAGPGGRNGELSISLGLMPMKAGFMISAKHSRTEALRSFCDLSTSAKLIASVSSASSSICLDSSSTFLAVNGVPELASEGRWSSREASDEAFGSHEGQVDNVLCVLCVRDAAAL